MRITRLKLAMILDSLRNLNGKHVADFTNKEQGGVGFG
jgi:hypothetical protein